MVFASTSTKPNDSYVVQRFIEMRDAKPNQDRYHA